MLCIYEYWLTEDDDSGVLDFLNTHVVNPVKDYFGWNEPEYPEYNEKSQYIPARGSSMSDLTNYIDNTNPHPDQFDTPKQNLNHNAVLMNRIKDASQQEIGVDDPRESWLRRVPYTKTRQLALKMDDLENFNRHMGNDQDLWYHRYKDQPYTPGFGALKNHLSDNWGKYLVGGALVGTGALAVNEEHRKQTGRPLFKFPSNNLGY